MRIVSLLPSATEIVCALGLSRQLVGVTHECDYPAEATRKPRMTRSVLGLEGASSTTIDRRVRAAVAAGKPLYEIDEDALRGARPDLILTQSLCRVCAPDQASVVELARKISSDIAVISLEPTSIEGIFNTISTVGAMTETERRAITLLGRLRGRLGRIERKVEKARAAGHQPLRVIGLEWLDPPMVVGHWVPEQIRRAGGWDLLGREGESSVRTTWQTIREMEPDMLLLMPCGYDMPGTVREFARMRRPKFWDEIFDPNRFVDVSPPMSWEPIPV